MSDELKDWERTQSLLVELERQESFKEWRDKVCLPLLDSLEYVKVNCLTQPEAELKAAILNELFVKNTFYKCFEQAKEVKQAQKESDEAVTE